MECSRGEGGGGKPPPCGIEGSEEKKKGRKKERNKGKCEDLKKGEDLYTPCPGSADLVNGTEDVRNGCGTELG